MEYELPAWAWRSTSRVAATEFWLSPSSRMSGPLQHRCAASTAASARPDGRTTAAQAAGRDFEKKRCCTPPRGIVDAAAGRLVTDNADRVGTTGRFPAIMRPPRKVSPFTPTGAGSSRAELPGRNGRDAATHSLVHRSQAQVGIRATRTQRRNASKSPSRPL